MQEGKKEKVRAMFDGIAHRYDFLNHFLSLGIDNLWRKKALRHLSSYTQPAILDVATGTGDFAIAALKYQPSHIIGIDLSEGMLQLGIEKIKNKGLASLIELMRGDSENLPFQDQKFDAVTVAFGVRNFENLEKGLTEMNRVLKVDGKVIILEFSKPESVFFRGMFNLYFFHILPFLGKLVSRHSTAYTYLPESVDAFPSGNKFLEIMTQCNFREVKAQKLSGGIATIYTGLK